MDQLTDHSEIPDAEGKRPYIATSQQSESPRVLIDSSVGHAVVSTALRTMGKVRHRQDCSTLVMYINHQMWQEPM